MAHCIAITNQKGGVGKTTTAVNLAVGLLRAGKRVLLVDIDPQCSLTYTLGGDSAQPGVMQLLMQQASAREILQHTEECDLIAASPALSGMDMTLQQTGKEFRLREGLAPLAADYDYIIMDSPPTLGVLTVNILTAADGVVIPALADIFSLQGVGQLYASIQAVKTYCNPGVRIEGILLTRHSDRLVLSREMRELMEETAAQMGCRVYRAHIREAVGLREAEASRQSIFRYAPKSRQAADYTAFIQEFLQTEGRQEKERAHV